MSPLETAPTISRAFASTLARAALLVTAAWALSPSVRAQCEAAKWSAPSTLASGAANVTLDLSGETVVVGRPGHDAHGLSDVGALAVRRRDGFHVWNVELELEPPLPFAYVERLGRAVAIDGNEIVATYRVRGDAVTAGFVHLQRGAEGWELHDAWTSSHAALGHGDAGLAIDGEWLVVGAPLANSGGATASGAVEVRRMVNGRFEPHAFLAASAPTSGALFGTDVAIDGPRLVVGAPGAGRVHVFELDGDAWQEVASHANAPSGHTEYGRVVALDNADVFVGARAANGVPTRVVHLVRASSSAPTPWSSVNVIEAPPGTGATQALGVSSELLVLGQPPLAAPAAGDVHLYQRKSAGTPWIDRGSVPLKSTPSTPATCHGALALDGRLLAVAVDTPTSEEVRIFEMNGIGDMLRACPSFISWTTKGDQFMPLDAGPSRAFYPYWVFGSVTGTSVGFNVSGVHVPINFDWYTQIGVYWPNSEFLYQNLGLLDQNGRATAVYALHQAVGTWSIGIVAHHVALVFDPNSMAVVEMSNVVTLEITP
jgi:hypothetical protein